MNGQVVGRVAALWRYPVKSMAGESQEHVDVSWHGLAGDRRWAFVGDGVGRSGFPWLTLRDRSDLLLHRPSLADPGRPDSSAAIVRTPAGAEYDAVDPVLAAELGHGARVIKLDRGAFDAMPLSLITTQTVAEIGALLGRELDTRRFRPNLVVDAGGEGPYQEDGWVGSVLDVGGMQMRVDRRDKRCVVVTVDPITTERDPAILRAIARRRESRLGVYGSTVRPGRVAVGDPVVRRAG